MLTRITQITNLDSGEAIEVTNYQIKNKPTFQRINTRNG